MKPGNRLAIFALALLTCSLSGCGYKLRGDYNFPDEFSSVYVESPSSALDLVTELVQSLDTDTSGVVLNRADATAVIRIISSTFTQRTLSFDSRGRPREFEMSYIVEFEVTIGGGDYLPRRSISLTRDYEFDGVDISAGGNQREIIRGNLQALMARSILRQIAARS